MWTAGNINGKKSYQSFFLGRWQDKKQGKAPIENNRGLKIGKGSALSLLENNIAVFVGLIDIFLGA